MPFIVFEGIDRAGKSTQCSLLVEYLQSNGLKTVLLKYPDRNSKYTGKLIDDYLAGRMELTQATPSLLMATNLWEMKEHLNQLIALGDTFVVMDRYTWSNIAYSTTRGMSLKAVKTISHGLPIPDCTVFVDADPQMVTTRGGFGEERFDNVQFQTSVSLIMRELADKLTDTKSVLRLDASLDPKVLFNTVKEQLGI